MLKKPIRNILAALGALALMSGAAAAQSKVTIAIGGAGCLCYLPTVLAEELGTRWASMVLAPMSFFSVYDVPVFAPAPWLRRIAERLVTVEAAKPCGARDGGSTSE